jgi:hypothetical protein
MKKLFSLAAIISTLVISYSCNDNFDPYGDFKDLYVLNCVVRGDSTFQSATLTRDYRVDNFNPYSNTTNETVKGAIIRIWSGKDKVTILRDTTIQRPAGDLYQSPYTVYYSNNFQPDPGTTIEIEAILPNGKKLTASTTTPEDIVMGTQETLIPSTTRNYLKYTWYSNQKNPVFITRLGIYYFKIENGQKVRHIAVVPESYSEYNGTWIPIYPKPITEEARTVDLGIFKKTMELISDGDQNKSNYIILGCILEVLSLDSGLSTYYNATARSNDIYSVKLDETDNTNITGGYGLFGVYNRTYSVGFLTHDYIKSFGYTPGLEEGK